ncbi:MAG: 4Fe-4S dicluster domain-containing protein [Betaproteobacteria bacterium]|nr:4Fe-4S dicluster domain-containing protein [Betaproteobacteria bacterium]
MSCNRNNQRRQFLSKGAALAAAVTIAPGLMLYDFARARPAGEPASSAVRWGMLIDAGQCESGCDACVSACNRENGLSGRTLPTDPQWIRKLELQQEGTGRKVSLPMMCQHCAEPPCVEVCPTGASFKRADGIVLVDKHLCIGCRYCMMACPYKARSFVHEPVVDHSGATPRGRGTVESCTLCVHRVDQGVAPACVEACAKEGHQAILFGNLNDPESAISKRLQSVTSVKLRADLNLDPGFSFVGL